MRETNHSALKSFVVNIAINYYVNLFTERKIINKVREKLQGYEIYFPKYRSPYKNENKGPVIIAMCVFCQSYTDFLHVNRHIDT